MPWYKIQDELEETRLARTGAAFGSIRRGIAYAYSDKYLKKVFPYLPGLLLLDWNRYMHHLLQALRFLQLFL